MQNLQHFTCNFTDIRPSITTADNRHQKFQVTQSCRTLARRFLAGTIIRAAIMYFHHTPQAVINNVTVTTVPAT